MSERVAVVGSRNYSDLEEVMAYVGTLPLGTVVVSGGARGVDQTAEGAARARGLTVISFRPVKRFGRWRIVRAAYVPGRDVVTGPLDETFATFGHAAYARNSLVVDAADRVEVFWSGESPGTRNTIALAEKVGKLGMVHRASLTRS